MTIHATIEVAEGTEYTAHCPNLQSLTARLASALTHAMISSTISQETPRVMVSHFDATPICGHCAAPLLASGACSNRQCSFGRVTPGKISARALAKAAGIKTGLASVLELSHAKSSDAHCLACGFHLVGGRYVGLCPKCGSERWYRTTLTPNA